MNGGMDGCMHVYRLCIVTILRAFWAQLCIACLMLKQTVRRGLSVLIADETCTGSDVSLPVMCPWMARFLVLNSRGNDHRTIAVLSVK